MAQYMADDNHRVGIIITGGAKSQFNHGLLSEDEYINTIKNAAKAGYHVLKNGGNAVEAVEKSVSVMENCELFEAGRGSYVNASREVECDAMIMEGHTLNTGAVISGRYFKNPVCLSRKILEETPHCALSGDGALDFAISIEFPCFEPNELITEDKMRKYIPHKRFNDRVNFFYEGEHIPDWGSKNSDDADTACAVAIDKNGNLACATSTGGIAGKRKGRVSGAALVGCGGYANDKGAAATTGHGEKLIKLTLARQVVIEMENGKNAQEATEEAVKLLTEKLKGHGGAIAIDKNGNFGKAFSTPLMSWASIKDDQLIGGFEKDEGKAKLLYNERLYN